MTGIVTGLLINATIVCALACFGWLALGALPHAPPQSGWWGVGAIAILIVGIAATTLAYRRMERWTFERLSRKTFLRRAALALSTLVITLAPSALIVVVIFVLAKSQG